MKQRYDVVPVHSFDEAVAHLEGVEAAVVGFHFDHRRPDRLLRVLQDRNIPTFCIRGVTGDESHDVLHQTIETYMNEFGCRDFIDFATQADDKALAALYARLDSLK
jgi:hypothetical protein